MSADCKHAGEFSADVNVYRLEDVGAYAAEIRITCAACGKPFRFVGVPRGVSSRQPTASPDHTALYAPIAPGGEEPGHYPAGVLHLWCCLDEPHGLLPAFEGMAGGRLVL